MLAYPFSSAGQAEIEPGLGRLQSFGRVLEAPR